MCRVTDITPPRIRRPGRDDAAGGGAVPGSQAALLIPGRNIAGTKIEESFNIRSPH